MMDDLKDNPLAAELIAEQAAAYFSTAKKMAAALKALRELDDQRKISSANVNERDQRREEILAEAAERAWFFIIQREALKLPYYAELFADFDIPDEVRQRMGPRKTS
jgi:hypothetical protein